MSDTPKLIAGISFEWRHIAGYYLRVRTFVPLADVSGDRVGSKSALGYGYIEAELPNPDVDAQQRIVTIPIERKNDCIALYRAHLDSGVKSGVNELIVLYDHHQGLFGRRKSSIHLACYPTGTWQGFFEAVDKYASEKFRWPEPLFFYQPSALAPFPVTKQPFFP